MHTKSQKQTLTLKSLLIATALTMGSFCGNTHASSQEELPEGFDATTYVGRYQDLSAAFSAQQEADLLTFAKTHFLLSGRHEEREARSYVSLGLPADFKEDTYLSLNPDVAEYAHAKGLNPIHFAISHYLSSGHHEERSYRLANQNFVLPEDFDAKTYLALNKDVEDYAVGKSLNTLEFAKEHYLTSGRNENRPYRIEISLPSSATPSSPPFAQPMVSLEEELHQALTQGKSQRVQEILELLSSSPFSAPSAIPTVPLPVHPHYQPYVAKQDPCAGSYQPTVPQNSLLQISPPRKPRNLEDALNAALDQENEELVRQLTQEMAGLEVHSSPKPKAHVPEVIPPIQDDSLEAQLQRAIAEDDEQTLFRLLNENDGKYAPKPSLVRDMAMAFESQGRGGNADQHQFMRGYEFDHGGRFVSGDQRDPTKMNNQQK